MAIFITLKDGKRVNVGSITFYNQGSPDINQSEREIPPGEKSISITPQSLIYFVHDSGINVQETPEEIDKLIWAAVDKATYDRALAECNVLNENRRPQDAL